MRGAQADGDEQVRALLRLRRDAAVADGVGAGADLDIALIAHKTLLGNVTLHVVRVHVVGAHAHAVFHDLAAFAVLLAHHVAADHAACLAHVELAGPVAVVFEFILGQTQFLEGGAHFFRHAGVVCIGPHKAFLPVFVGFPNLRAGLVVGVWVIKILADEVGADGEVVVRVGLAVGHPGGGPGDAFVTGFDIAQRQFEPLLVVVGGLLPVEAVFRHVGGAHAEVVGLQLAVAAFFLADVAGVNAGQHAALRIAGLHIGIDIFDELMMNGFHLLHAVDRLAKLRIRLAAHGVAHARLRHQVALIGGVDEHLALKGAAALHDDLRDASALFDHALFQVQAFAEHHGHLVFHGGEHGVVDLCGHMRLEGPHGVFAAGVAVLLFGEVFLPGLVLPLGRVIVIFEDVGVKLTRHAADGLLVADVRRTKSAGGQAAEKLCGFDEDGGFAHARRLDGRRDSSGGAAIDDDVIRICRRERGNGGERNNEEGWEELHGRRHPAAGGMFLQLSGCIPRCSENIIE